MSPAPVRTSRPDAARIHDVAEGASPEFIGRLPLEDTNASATDCVDQEHFLANGDAVLIPRGGLGISWCVGLAFDAKISVRHEPA